MADYQCYTCKKSFGSKHSVENHCKDLKHSRTWDCGWCSHKFDNQEDLDDHETDHASSYCDHCRKQFIGVPDAAHVHRCDQCQRNFVNLEALQQHLGHSPAHKKVKCFHCKNSFKDEDSLQIHMESAHEIPCAHCNKILTSIDNLQSHMKAKHSFKCDHCTNFFCSIDSRKEHIGLTHKFPCIRCTTPFEKESQLMIHYTDKHPLMCFKCGTLFSDKSTLRNHAETHIHKCKGCSKEFPTAERLLDHHCLLHRSKCPHCTQTFHSLDAFIKHYERAHKEKVPTKDPASGASTSSVLVYQSPTKTMDMTTRTAKYWCEECDDYFKDDEEWARHEEHSPFHHPKVLRCDECNLKFEDQISLLGHIDSKPHKARWVLVVI